MTYIHEVVTYHTLQEGGCDSCMVGFGKIHNNGSSFSCQALLYAMYIYIYIYMHMYVYIYIYIHTHTYVICILYITAPCSKVTG